MTHPRIEKIGLVSDRTLAGEWAFEASFHLSKKCAATLNIFEFFHSPFNISTEEECGDLFSEECEIRRDRELREFYDGRLGDWVEVGFRVCGGRRHNLELRRCLQQRDFQILFLPCSEFGVGFGMIPIEEFAWRFPAPVVLVGPRKEDPWRVNPPGRILLAKNLLSGNRLVFLPEPDAFDHYETG